MGHTKDASGSGSQNPAPTEPEAVTVVLRGDAGDEGNKGSQKDSFRDALFVMEVSWSSVLLSIHLDN